MEKSMRVMTDIYYLLTHSHHRLGHLTIYTYPFAGRPIPLSNFFPSHYSSPQEKHIPQPISPLREEES